jgi:hypothetical protein
MRITYSALALAHDLSLALIGSWITQHLTLPDDN